MSDEPAPCGPLTTANARLHDAIDEALLDVMEAVTALDGAAMRTRWSRFIALLEAHAEHEEVEVFPRYAALDDHPRGGGPDLFVADHVSLRKVTAAAAEAIDAIHAAGPQARRVMVTRLGPLVRLGNVLEHHTLREERFLYPRLDETLCTQDVEVLARGIRETPSSPPGRSSG